MLHETLKLTHFLTNNHLQQSVMKQFVNIEIIINAI